MKEVLSYPLAKIKTDGNIRSDLGSEDELRGLGLDMKANGQQMPCLVDPDDILLDGYRRLAAAKLVDLPTLDCIRMPKKLLGAEAKKLQLASVLHRKDLTSWEKAVAAKEIKDANPGMTNVQLADEVFHINASGLTRLMAVWACVQEVKDALRDGRVSVADVYKISQNKTEDQLAALDVKLGNLVTPKLAKPPAANGKPNGQAPSSDGKGIKVQIPLTTEKATGKVTVIGQPGKDVDLDIVEALLKEALRATKAAKEKNLSLASAQGVWKDMAAVVAPSAG